MQIHEAGLLKQSKLEVDSDSSLMWCEDGNVDMVCCQCKYFGWRGGYLLLCGNLGWFHTNMKCLSIVSHLLSGDSVSRRMLTI